MWIYAPMYECMYECVCISMQLMRLIEADEHPKILQNVLVR